MVISELRMNPNHVCFGHMLQGGGYDTAYIGKWHLWGASPENYGTEVGQFVPPGPHRLGFDGYWAATNSWHEYYRSFYYGNGPQPVAMHGYEPDVQTDLAIRWMQENIEGSPVIVEGNMVEYHWGNRYTIYTGLPSVVGWNWHQRQQRAALPDGTVESRVADVGAFYSTTNIEEVQGQYRQG